MALSDENHRVLYQDLVHGYIPDMVTMNEVQEDECRYTLCGFAIVYDKNGVFVIDTYDRNVTAKWTKRPVSLTEAPVSCLICLSNGRH